MSAQKPLAAKLLDFVVDHLDIPKSYYERAARRHKSLGFWLCRPESSVAIYGPHVYLQGSFRYGTVNRPIRASEVYDLDNVTTLAIPKAAMTQKQIKELYGLEIKAYALAHGMLEPVEEKDRCWRLIYTDEANFHLDSLPCLPEDDQAIRAIAARGVPLPLAIMAVAITDKRHPQYSQVTRTLLSSNPAGFAVWFEDRTRPVALTRMQRLVEARLYASVDDVPPYEWKTPLQRSIQLLKRHRDVMFMDEPASAPISMIITNLAAHSYGGEGDIWLAICAIVERMPEFVRAGRPRVPNPADPAEDYADKWAKDPALEKNFWAWHAQAQADITRVANAVGSRRLSAEVRSVFGVDLSDEEMGALGSYGIGSPAIVMGSTPIVQIPSAPRPWRDRD